MTPFTATLRSEWAKLVALRSTWVTVGLSVVLGVGVSALLAVIVGATYDSWPAEDVAAFDPIEASQVGTVVSAVLLVGFGVTAGTSEYTSGMIRLTLTATPRRWRVLTAKAASVVAITLMAGLLSSTGMFLVFQAIIDSYGLAQASLGDGAAARTVLVNGALWPVLPLVAMAMGMSLRSTAPAVTAVLALVFVPAILGGLLPQWWRDHVLAWMLGPATDTLAFGHLYDDPSGLLHPAAGVLAVAGWLAAFLGVAAASLTRRDA